MSGSHNSLNDSHKHLVFMTSKVNCLVNEIMIIITPTSKPSSLIVIKVTSVALCLVKVRSRCFVCRSTKMKVKGGSLYNNQALTSAL